MTSWTDTITVDGTEVEIEREGTFVHSVETCGYCGATDVYKTSPGFFKCPDCGRMTNVHQAE